MKTIIYMSLISILFSCFTPSIKGNDFYKKQIEEKTKEKIIIESIEQTRDNNTWAKYIEVIAHLKDEPNFRFSNTFSIKNHTLTKTWYYEKIWSYYLTKDVNEILTKDFKPFQSKSTFWRDDFRNTEFKKLPTYQEFAKRDTFCRISINLHLFEDLNDSSKNEQFNKLIKIINHFKTLSFDEVKINISWFDEAFFKTIDISKYKPGFTKISKETISGGFKEQLKARLYIKYDTKNIIPTADTLFKLVDFEPSIYGSKCRSL